MTPRPAEGSRSTDPGVVGAKAARLAELINHGLPVPPFAVIPVASSSRVDPATPDPELAAEIDRHLAAFDSKDRFVVRSSAVGEDADRASHAGQFLSVVGVTRSGVVEAVHRVIASADRENVARYRERRGLPVEPVAMAAIIQVLVDARAAGVAFTADPVTGARTQVVVAALGLGAGVVDDRVPSDSYRRPLGALQWERSVAVKFERLVLADDGEGVRADRVAPDQAERPVLTPSELERLGAVLEQVDALSKGPQDVEWAIDSAGQVWLLQARPATAVPAPPLEVWDDSNVGENYPGVTRPLTFSVASRTYRRLFARAMEEIGVPPAVVAAQKGALGQLLGLIQGRLYLNLTSYYQIFGSVTGLQGTVVAWRAALGIQDQTSTPRRSGGPFDGIGTWSRLIHRYLTNDRHVTTCLTSTNEILDAARQERIGPDSAAIIAAFGRLEKALLSGWTAIIYDDFFLFLLLDQLGRLLDGQSGALQEVLAGVGGRGMASLKAADSLRDLSAQALSLPGALDLLGSGIGDDRRVWDELLRRDGDQAFRTAVEGHFALHGDRGIGELKLETEMPADMPWTLVPLFRRAAVEPLSRSVEVASGAMARMLAARFPGRPVARVAGGWLLARCRHLIVHRENLSDARARAYGVIRCLFRELGTALTLEGHLEAPTQVFDILIEELEEFAAGRMPEGELRRLAQSRQARYARWASVPPPPHRIVVGTGSCPISAPSEQADLQGTPCSAGIVTGPVRGILQPTGAESLRDEILVAPVTELGWLPLLLQARGLLIERGSILSHAAIIARELGLPTIVGLPGVTTRLRDGDVVEMNGGTGVVVIRRR